MDDKETSFVLVSDQNYFPRAKQTINDLRVRGKWIGDICLITIDFELDNNIRDYYNIIEVKKKPIDKQKLIDLIPKGGFPGSDGREINLVNQWEKLQVFDDYFKNWKRIVFVDAGMRILDSVKYLLELEYEGHILQHYEGHSKFYDAIYKDDKNTLDKVLSDFGDNVLNESVYLNGSWIYDTSILGICNKDTLIQGMYDYPICLRNEMTLMQLFFHFKHGLVKPYPMKTSNGKYLFGWSDVDYVGTTWRDFCMIKYPVTIQFI